MHECVKIANSLVLTSNPSKNILSTAIRTNEAIRDLDCWGNALDEELRRELRANSGKEALLQTIATYTRQMAEAELDRDQLFKFAGDYSRKYGLTAEQASAVSLAGKEQALNAMIKADTGSAGSANSVRSEDKNLKAEELKGRGKDDDKGEKAEDGGKDLKRYQTKAALTERKTSSKLAEVRKAVKKETPRSTKTLPSSN